MTCSLKSVVVTGAGSGLGRSVSLALAAQAVPVFCLDLDPQKLGETVDEIRASGGEAEAFTADVSDAGSISRAFAAIAASGKPVEGIVTCAGVRNTTSILDLGVDEWERVMAVNLRGTFLCVQAALRTMIPRENGRIVTIGSDTGKRGGGRVSKAAYGASKGGVILFTRSLARELASYGGRIRVNCVCPGPMLTGMTAGGAGDGAPRPHGSVPIGRYGATDEVAAAIMFLLSDKASFVYGETMSVDGGMAMD